MSQPKVHYAAYLDSSTSCGLALRWQRDGDDGPRKPFRNEKPVAVSKWERDVTCDSCWRSCS